ncbi:MAG: DUF302 domain-containing protein [Candidatus Eremiobacteraeota bacterium]|uniref:DUF302 domain-containing protein n=1 Tax=mine drainage metagenome TaxID=410659 RepID=E6PF58_9ZZZZ|nr:DUF302 domain-containing protein [Candidatus Eremiobacteraeota bacterium]
MKYGHETVVEGKFEEVIDRTKAALAERGFGVLTEIDVAATLKKKIGAEMEPYVILGACNPTFAHEALQREPDLGLLLPCNVVVMQKAGKTYVKAIDAGAMLGVTGNTELVGVAGEVDALLKETLNALKG